MMDMGGKSGMGGVGGTSKMGGMSAEPKPAAPKPAAPEPETPSESSPSFTLDGDKAAEFLSAFPCQVGDTFTVTDVNTDEGKQSVTLQPEDESSEGDEGDAEQEKILGYKRSTESKEAPPFGGAEGLRD